MSGISWAPVDSTDARERRELEEESCSAGPAAPKPARVHDPRCQGGWLAEDEDGRPVPCLFCRPWLRATACRSCQVLPLVCTAQAAVTTAPCCEDCDHRPTAPAAAGGE